MDKYPELEEFSASGEQDKGDFLAREKELLGDEFGPAEHEQQSEPEPEEHDEQEAASAAASEAETQQSSTKESSPSSPSTPAASSGPSQFLQEWKVKHELEVERRDKASAEKQAEIRAKAQSAIDDFYANYNSKKEQSTAQVRKEAEQFVKDRDEQNKGSTWDKVASLIEEAKVAEGVKPVDKSRFKELVSGLKGDPDAPGAGGY